MDTPRLVLLLFLLLFLFLSPDSQSSSISQQRELDFSIIREKHDLDVLNTSSYGSFDSQNDRWLNITGLRQNDGFAWDMLPKVQQRAKQQLQTILRAFGSSRSYSNASLLSLSEDGEPSHVQAALSGMKPFNDPPPIYENVTGITHGKWVRSQVEAGLPYPLINLTAVAPMVTYGSNKYNRNITGQTGDLRIHVDEKVSEELPSAPGLVRVVKGQMTIKDETSSGDGWEITLWGVHYPQQGGILLSTTSEK